MIIETGGIRRHLTYCLNIHPGESWEDNRQAIVKHAFAVKRAIAPEQSFGLGLRLGAVAAEFLAASPAAIAELRSLLEANDCYAFTVNGFPYGKFHGGAVKAAVYAPDWSSPERLDYTIKLFDILAALMPAGTAGSVSTVPGTYKAWLDKDRMAAIARNLAKTAMAAAKIEDQSGRHLVLALEPEPDCLLENTDEAITFLCDTLPELAIPHLRRQGLGGEAAAAILRRHVGVCLDTSHAAVAFESPTACLRRLRAAGLALGKIQLGAALRWRPDARGVRDLAAFADPSYLHQVKIGGGGRVAAAYPDLPEARAAFAAGTSPEAEEWRVHFHVPLFMRNFGVLSSTADELDSEFFQAILADPGITQLEVETYTFGVLPPEHRPESVDECVAKELRWTLGQLAAAAGTT